MSPRAKASQVPAETSEGLGTPALDVIAVHVMICDSKSAIAPHLKLRYER